MQFPSSSYNDYVHHPLFFPSRLAFSSHNLIPLLILNNILFMLCAFFFFLFLAVVALLYYSLRFELIFLFPSQSLLKHKTINHKHKILHLFIIFLRLLCVNERGCFYCFILLEKRKVFVSYVTSRINS